MEQKQAGLFNRTKLHVFRDWLTGRPSTVRCRRRRTGVDDWIPKNRSTIHNCVEESSLVSACTLKENELETQGHRSRQIRLQVTAGQLHGKSAMGLLTILQKNKCRLILGEGTLTRT